MLMPSIGKEVLHTLRRPRLETRQTFWQPASRTLQILPNYGLKDVSYLYYVGLHPFIIVIVSDTALSYAKLSDAKNSGFV